MASSENTYIADAENPVEMARLIRQDRLITETMGALLPRSVSPQTVHHVLDIGCGPGGWALDVAHELPQAQVVGVDISKLMLTSARQYARAEGVQNIEFLETDARNPLPFPDASFDLINARLISSFMLPALWPRVLGDCFRMLTPGGCLRVTELETNFSTSLAAEKINGAFYAAMSKAGYTFSPSGRGFGLSPVLRRLLSDVGVEHIDHCAYGLDCSYGTALFSGLVEDFTLMYHSFMPFIVKAGAANREEMDELFVQAKADMKQPTFCAMTYLLSAWGVKPIR